MNLVEQARENFKNKMPTWSNQGPLADRIEELEGQVNAKDERITALQDALSDAISTFQDKEVFVSEERIETWEAIVNES